MATVDANGIRIYYETQGAGEPLILIPYLAADNACYAFQVAEYAKHFTCISIDPRGAGQSDKPAGTYTTELFADDVAAFMQALGIAKAHVAGLSLGAAVGAWLAAKYPDRVSSLSLHAVWSRTDAFLTTVVSTWRTLARAFGRVDDVIVNGIFPWCFTPEMYAARPEYVQALSDFVRSRPAQPVAAFLQQTDAVLAHNVEGALARIVAPTLITFGRRDALTSTRFADAFTASIPGTETIVFEDCAHAAMYEQVDTFNQRTLDFLRRHAGVAVA